MGEKAPAKADAQGKKKIGSFTSDEMTNRRGKSSPRTLMRKCKDCSVRWEEFSCARQYDSRMGRRVKGGKGGKKGRGKKKRMPLLERQLLLRCSVKGTCNQDVTSGCGCRENSIGRKNATW